MLRFFKRWIKPFYYSYINYVYTRNYHKNPMDIKVLSIEETIDIIKKNGSSVVRFGDGEINIISGESIVFQEYNQELAEKLSSILSKQNSEDFLICAPDIFIDLNRYVGEARTFWLIHRSKNSDIYRKIMKDTWYGNAFISRPYITYKNKNIDFNRIKSLWDGRDLLIVEGVNSKSGVGNNLFENAGSISRIICPASNAFSVYEDIKQATEEYADDRLVLVMLGPTAKLLVHDLFQVGIQAIDIGHIDTEYEWFKMQAQEKVKLPHKHTAEFNDDKDINFVYNGQYEREIIKDLSLVTTDE